MRAGYPGATMAEQQQKNLVLILVRELAAHVASPVFVVDAWGTLVYYNERAEKILGLRFDEAGELSADEWGTRWSPEDLNGNPLKPEQLPLSVSLTERRPVHAPIRIAGSDGQRRVIEVSAIPLFAAGEKFVGAMALFWEP